ncbi:MAG: APC family permease [Gammaproteobacteria bacterium]|nr:APC family permease [Gammaproteobacteria bacterium]
MDGSRISHKKILGPFALAMIAVAAIIDLRGLPMMASYGFGVIFVYGVAALMFLIPSGLVCAELSTHIKQPGGMYVWIRSAFGDKAGFLSIWLEWLNNVIGFPASLSFISVTLSYLINPALAQNKVLVLISTLTILWSVTFFTMLGVKASSRLNMLGALLGTMIPALIIIALSVTWVLLGKPLQVDVSWSSVIPSFKNSNPGFFAAIILGFGGMQIVAFHTVNVRDPNRTFPLAILSAVLIIVAVALFTSLAIAVVVPHQQLNLISGLIDGFSRFFQAFQMSWATPVIVLMIILSMLATLNAWFLGPARGLAVAAQNGFLPKTLAKLNRKEMPGHILLLQAIVGTLLSTIFLYMPDISSAFWILLNLSSQSALLVYILIFASAIKRRYMPTTETLTGFRIPFGNVGIWIVAGVGIITCVIALMASVIPPGLVKTGSIWRYEGILLLSNLIFLSVPFFIISYYTYQNHRNSLSVSQS